MTKVWTSMLTSLHDAGETLVTYLHIRQTDMENYIEYLKYQVGTTVIFVLYKTCFVWLKEV